VSRLLVRGILGGFLAFVLIRKLAILGESKSLFCEQCSLYMSYSGQGSVLLLCSWSYNVDVAPVACSFSGCIWPCARRMCYALPL